VIGEQLQALIALQQVDTSLDQLRHRRAHLPERTDLRTIDQNISELNEAAGQVTRDRDEIAAQQSHLEQELAATEARADAVNRRLYGGTVSASRELQAMAADVEALKTRASALEDEVLEVMERREPVDARLADLSEQLATLEARRRVTTGALQGAEAAVDEELARLQGARATAAGSVPGELLTSYDQLRAHLGGVAVARLVANRCDGCHLTLPAVELDRIRHLPADEVVTCEQCGRILVRD
jgi:predicted  nucleic acid-binding Zn-ribbon protein